MKTLFILTITIVIASGCVSRAGPFVTGISNDGDGYLTVEKCMMKFDSFNDSVANERCTSTHIKLPQ